MTINSIFPFFLSIYHIAAGVLGIGFLIGFHELGHFLFAKLFHVDTPSFALGFGPALFQKKIGKTHFRIAAIPLGGYVELAGAAEVGQGEQKEAYRRDKYSFAVKPYYQKLLIMLGGILFNLLFAYAALVLLFSLGVPKTVSLSPLNTTTIIDTVAPDSAALKAGLLAGDEIISVDKEPVADSTLKLLTKIQSHAPGIVNLGIIRNKQEQIIPIELAPVVAGGTARGRLGITFANKDIPAQDFSGALRSGITQTNHLIRDTIGGFLALFKQRSTANMGGPLMIISQITQGARQGFKVWLLLLALISINLAILNLIPLPILDGGQILFYSIEALIGRPLPESIRMGIHYVSWGLILTLILYLSVKDCKNLLSRWWS